jgi:hypothetical protein
MNHLNHAQSTWSNQIVSGRNIWIAHGRPIDKLKLKLLKLKLRDMGLFRIFKHTR